MDKKKEKQSGIPLVVIGLVLVAAVILFAYCSNGKNGNNSGAKPTPTPAPKATIDQSKAPIGAQPPNMLGSPNASVTVEEFGDFQCPTCGTMYPVLHEIQSIYGPRIKFIFRNYPLPMHDKAYDAATAAEAAGLQGSDKYWAMHAQLYTNQKTWSADPNYKQLFKGYAEKIGLDVDRFQTDMAGLQTRNRIQADVDRSKGLNVSSTPTVFINGNEVPFPQMNVPSMQKMIDDALKAPQGAQQPAQSAPATSSNNSTNSSK